MGQIDDQRITRRDKARRKADEQKERRDARNKLRGNQAPATWSSVTPAVVSALVGAVTKKGGAVMFGQTRDKGAMILTIYLNEEMTKEYFRPSDDVDAIILRYVADIDPPTEVQTTMPL